MAIYPTIIEAFQNKYSTPTRFPAVTAAFSYDNGALPFYNATHDLEAANDG